MKTKLKKKTTSQCWNCRQKKFKPKKIGEVGSPFCEYRQEWFKPGYNFGNDIDCEGYI